MPDNGYEPLVSGCGVFEEKLNGFGNGGGILNDFQRIVLLEVYRVANKSFKFSFSKM